MKSRLLLVTLASLILPVSGVARDEDEVLHAIFVAYQSPGIFSAAEIAASRRTIRQAALKGHPQARLVVAPRRVEEAGEDGQR